MQPEPDSAQKQTRSPGRLMQAATYAAMASAAVLVMVKASAYFDTKSVAVLSSLADSALDFLASVLTFIAVRFALTPADEGHRFGHGKAEPLSGLGQAAFVAGSAVLILVEAVSRFHTPTPVEDGSIGIAVMIFSLVVTLMLVAFQRHVVRKTKSTAIGADALHYTGDVLMTLGVIASLYLSSNLGVTWADAVFGVGISAFMLVNAIRIAVAAVGGLMDHELPEEERSAIVVAARRHTKVKHVHELRTRSSGLQKFIQMHIVLDRELTLLEAHRISDEVEAAVLAAFPGADVIIHQDPDDIAEVHQPVGAALS
jgi:ferrous-iron efflux pump FieF